ncbi:hypothetical protein Vafri_9660 [Volvox africanus]|uniref:Uncharacterized protein n=1 Tax=Volvox africanus TaxID=51714 RepID=A0A8J4B9H0_9CHLO|nr:hypothetical protein Vafri_9660 [Volvox africanus]
MMRQQRTAPSRPPAVLKPNSAKLASTWAETPVGVKGTATPSRLGAAASIEAAPRTWIIGAVVMLRPDDTNGFGLAGVLGTSDMDVSTAAESPLLLLARDKTGDGVADVVTDATAETADGESVSLNGCPATAVGPSECRMPTGAIVSAAVVSIIARM